MKKTEKNQLELYFEWWLVEMQSLGYINNFVREPETQTVMEAGEYGRYKRFKTKEKEVEQFNLFPKITYTYDYKIIWNKSAEFLFYEEIMEQSIFLFSKPPFIASREASLIEGDEYIVSYVDVKPTNSVQQRGGKVSSAISFPLKQRMLWERDRTYINKVVPMPMAGTGYNSALFVKTFVPQRYLLTDGGKMRRKIKYKTTSLKEFVNTKTIYINNLLKNTK